MRNTVNSSNSVQQDIQKISDMDGMKTYLTTTCKNKGARNFAEFVYTTHLKPLMARIIELKKGDMVKCLLTKYFLFPFVLSNRPEDYNDLCIQLIIDNILKTGSPELMIALANVYYSYLTNCMENMKNSFQASVVSAMLQLALEFPESLLADDACVFYAKLQVLQAKENKMGEITKKQVDDLFQNLAPKTNLAEISARIDTTTGKTVYFADPLLAKKEMKPSSDRYSLDVEGNIITK